MYLCVMLCEDAYVFKTGYFPLNVLENALNRHWIPISLLVPMKKIAFYTDNSAAECCVRQHRQLLRLMEQAELTKPRCIPEEKITETKQ